MACVFFSARAQHLSMTLDECMRLGIERNLKVKTAQIDSKIACNKYVAGVGAFLPEVDANGNAGKRFGRSVDPKTNMYTSTSFIESNIGLAITFPLFEGFTRINRVKFEGLNKHISKLNIEQFENETAYNVMEAFYNVVLEDSLLKHTREQRKLTEQYRRQMAVFLELGMRLPADMQEINARLQADIYQETYRDNSCRMALLALKQLLNLPENALLEIHYIEQKATKHLPDVMPADSLYEASLVILPEAIAMDLKIKAARKLLTIARGHLFPVIRAEYSLYSGYYNTARDEQGHVIPFSTQFNNNLNYYAGIKVSIPVLGGLKRITTLKNEQLNLQRTEVAVQQQKQSLRADIENACLSLQASAQEYVKATEQLKAEKLTLKDAHRKWEEGLLSIFELMEIRNRYIAACAEVTRTGIQYDMQQKIIGFYRTGSFFSKINE